MLRTAVLALLFLGAVSGINLPSLNRIERNITKSQSEIAPKVVVNAYYEVLCPDSIRFVRSQLAPTYSMLSEIMEYNLIPYGKASSTAKPDGGYEFQCQHGEIECQGNMIHACSAKYIESKSQLMEYVSCMIEDNRKPLIKGMTCAKIHHVDWHPIKNCAESVEGQNLLFEEGEKTMALDPSLVFVPTVEINQSQANQRNLLLNLAPQVCKAYTGTLPSACNQFLN